MTRTIKEIEEEHKTHDWTQCTCYKEKYYIQEQVSTILNHQLEILKKIKKEIYNSSHIHINSHERYTDIKDIEEIFSKYGVQE